MLWMSIDWMLGFKDWKIVGISCFSYSILAGDYLSLDIANDGLGQTGGRAVGWLFRLTVDLNSKHGT